MNTEPFYSIIVLVASPLFALIPLKQSRVRASWAKIIFVAVGVVGLVLSATKLVVMAHWVEPSAEATRSFHQLRVLLCGFALGLMAALILSRQILGEKRTSNEFKIN